MVDIQYDTTIMGGREVSRPYRVGFSPKASGFYPFGDATALAGEGGVGDVVCLIQASASNHKPKKPQTKGTVLSNQRDGSFGLYMPEAYQKNRPFGLWFMWFAWNQT